MSWILPTKRSLQPLVALTRPRSQRDRHRPGYFRDYYQRNIAKLRPYLAAKQREYRKRKASHAKRA